MAVDPVQWDPDTLLSSLPNTLRQSGRRIDALVFAATALDITDGQPAGTHVGAHRRAGWLEASDRLYGEPTPHTRLLMPDLPSWTPDENLRGVWDPHRSDRAALWVRVLAGRAPGVVLESPRPLDPARAVAWLMRPWPGVVRARGFVWTLDRPSVVVDLNRIGEHPAMTGIGTWWVGSPRNTWPRAEARLARLKRDWHADFGDRICRLAILGISLDEAALREDFEAALVPANQLADWTDSAMTPRPFL